MAEAILIITGDAGESYECWYARPPAARGGAYAADRRRRAAGACTWSSTTSSPAGTPTSSGPGYGAESDLTFDEVKPEDYAAVLVLGGRAPEYLRHDPRVLNLVRAFDKAGKWVFAICHGVQILAAAGMLAGRRVTAYENCRWEIESAGRHVHHGPASRPRRSHRHRPDLAVAS
jgi:protease I